jgi:asparagine synthase (glutamine-hydrolysing)
MCGIVGIFSYNGPPPFTELWPDFINHLAHRGPDEGAWWSDDKYFFGHRRLSIIDLQSGGQPMATANGDLIVVFNGEIYNYIELRNELQNKGYVFQTHSDTEVLLHGYHAWGINLPSKLTGMFAFAIADRRKQELFLARDRFGEKPLFILQASNYIAFASELRPLAALPDLDRNLDIEALAGYLCLNYVPGNLTLMKGIKRVPPGTWMSFDVHGSHRCETYWRPEIKKNTPSEKSTGDALEELKEQLDRSVKLCLRSDVPLGIFLSGGIDSSLIAESAVRQGNLSHAYFIDFEDTRYSEYAAAQHVAQRLNLNLVKTTLSSDELKNFLSFVEHADDPLADSSMVAVWAISRLAARQNKVVLAGDGGDELFGGYLTYRASLLHSQYVAGLPVAIKKTIARIGASIPTAEGKVTFSYKLRRFLRAADLPTHQAHFTWNGTWLPEEAAGFINPAFERSVVANALQDYTSRLGLSCGELHQLQKSDLLEYLPNDILTKVDRMTMAHGVESRAPFLNHTFAEWAMQLPDNLKVNYGKSKLLLRERTRQVFGREIADRPKQGFSIPIHEWIRGPLKETIRDLLSPESISQLNVFEVPALQRVIKDHFSGRKSYGFELWGLAVLVAWHRSRIQHPPQTPRKLDLIQRVYPL